MAMKIFVTIFSVGCFAAVASHQQNDGNEVRYGPSYIGLARALQQRTLASSLNSSEHSEIAHNIFQTLSASLLKTGAATNSSSQLEDMSVDEWPGSLAELLKIIERIAEKFAEGHFYHNVSSVCAQHIDALLGAVVTSKGSDKWALRFIDAVGRPEAGLLDANLYWYGSYDECADILHVDDKGRDRGFGGRYCVADLGPPQNVTASALVPQKALGINWGFCIPDSCSKKDFVMIWNDVLNDVPHLPYHPVTSRIVANWAQCDRVGDENRLDGPAITIVVVMAVFAFFVVIGTLLDALLPYWHPRSSAIVVPITSETFSANVPNTDPIVITTVPAKSTKHTIDHSRLPIWARALLAFSALSNGRRILATVAHPPMSALHKDAHKAPVTTTQLHSVHGIRFLSMSWVILGHSYAFSIFLVSNPVKIFVVTKDFLFHLVLSGTVAVDTFFMLSGMLVVYLLLHEWHKRKHVNWFLYYFHRYWRLTPVYMICLGFVAGLLPFLLHGPNQYINDSWAPDRCANSWWTNALYLNNFIHFDEQCVGWTWYLANDMQFYVFAPLVLAPLVYIGLWAGLGVLGVIFVGHVVCTAIISSTLNLPITFFFANMLKDQSGLEKYFKWYYMRPWTRAGPYLIGILLGIILFKWQLQNEARRREQKKSLRLPWFVVVSGWIVAGGVSLAVVFSLYPTYRDGDDYSGPVRALYNSTLRFAWAASIAWVIFACETGYGGFINTILSWQALVPLSRLTYCAYLFHLPIITLVNGNITQEMAFSHLTLVLHNFGFLFATYLLSFALSIVFEAPMLGLEKLLMAGLHGRGGARHQRTYHVEPIIDGPMARPARSAPSVNHVD